MARIEVSRPDDPEPDWGAQPSGMLVRLFGDNAARWRLQFFSFGGRSMLLTGGTPARCPSVTRRRPR